MYDELQQAATQEQEYPTLYYTGTLRYCVAKKGEEV